MMDENPWPELDRDRVKEIIFHAEEPLTVHEIIGRMTGKMSERKTKQELDRLMDEGVVGHGPEETADGIMGLVEREPTYRLVEPEDDGTS